MIALLVALATQSTVPTVGDTIWVSRIVEAPAGAEVRAGAWQLDGNLVVLGPAVIVRAAGTVLVRYPVTAWVAGEHRLSVPGPIVVGVDGRSDSLPPETVVVRVASILPAGSDPAATVIEAELAPVPETVTTPVPLLVLLGVALLVVAPTTWWWRRRRRPGAAPSALGSTDATIPVDAWAEDGESRAVAAASARMMRRSLLASLPGAQPGHPTSRLVAQADVRRPALPVDDLVQVLGELEAAAFDRSADADVGDLARRAGELRSKLPGPSA